MLPAGRQTAARVVTKEGTLQHTSDANAAAAGLFAGGFLLIWFVFALGILILSLVVNWKIASKAGYSGVLSLLMLIPLVNFVVLLMFAFSEWPIEQQLRGTRSPAAPYPPFQ